MVDVPGRTRPCLLFFLFHFTHYHHNHSYGPSNFVAAEAASVCPERCKGLLGEHSWSQACTRDITSPSTTEFSVQIVSKLLFPLSIYGDAKEELFCQPGFSIP